jgi:hypothetical protein
LEGPDPSREIVREQQQRMLDKIAAELQAQVPPQTDPIEPEEISIKPVVATETMTQEIRTLRAQMSILRRRMEELEMEARGGNAERSSQGPPSYEGGVNPFQD